MSELNQGIEANQDPTRLLHTSLAHVLGDQALDLGPKPGMMMTLLDGRKMEYSEMMRYLTDDNTIYTSSLTGEKYTYKEMKERGRKDRERYECDEKIITGPP